MLRQRHVIRFDADSLYPGLRDKAGRVIVQSTGRIANLGVKPGTFVGQLRLVTRVAQDDGC